LYEQGIVYENANHRHANTETVVGHATLATGADPSEHGMIGNLWYDKELRRRQLQAQMADHLQRLLQPPSAMNWHYPPMAKPSGLANQVGNLCQAPIIIAIIPFG
jgi:hypothetical protein